jgi:hypothetical protein
MKTRVAIAFGGIVRMLLVELESITEIPGYMSTSGFVRHSISILFLNWAPGSGFFCAPIPVRLILRSCTDFSRPGSRGRVGGVANSGSRSLVPVPNSLNDLKEA